jgi:hypothetical protein
MFSSAANCSRIVCFLHLEGSGVDGMLIRTRTGILVFPCSGISLDEQGVAGYNLKSTRASPSGKASAFQADIRGFESHRPLFCFKWPLSKSLRVKPPNPLCSSLSMYDHDLLGIFKLFTDQDHCLKWIEIFKNDFGIIGSDYFFIRKDLFPGLFFTLSANCNSSGR